MPDADPAFIFSPRWEPSGRAPAVDGAFVTWMERRGYAGRTIRSYGLAVARAQSWLKTHRRPPMPRCTWKDMREFGESLPNTYASRTGMRSALTAYWSFLNKKNGLAWAIQSPKKPEPVCKAVTPADLERALNVARSLGPQVYAQCCCLYYAGLRREEVARLRWDELGRDIRIVGKGAQEAHVPIHAKLAEALQALTPESPWVFPGRLPGSHISPATLNARVREIGVAAGIHLTPHMFRHTAIATVHDATELRTAATFARHKDVRVTMTYTRTTGERLQRGMDAL